MIEANSVYRPLGLFNLSDSIIASALQLTCEFLFGNRLLHFCLPDIETIVSTIKLKANAGFHHFTSRLCNKGTVYYHILDFLFDFLDDPDSDIVVNVFAYPILIFTRLQVKLKGIKMRIVYAIPGLITICQSPL
jgi:hypothetical protein